MLGKFLAIPLLGAQEEGDAVVGTGYNQGDVARSNPCQPVTAYSVGQQDVVGTRIGRVYCPLDLFVEFFGFVMQADLKDLHFDFTFCARTASLGQERLDLHPDKFTSYDLEPYCLTPYPGTAVSVPWSDNVRIDDGFLAGHSASPQRLQILRPVPC